MSTQASNTTANYHLSQWSETDRILMADFNHDNAAIDAQLKANADSITEAAAELTSQIAWVKLLETTPTTASAVNVTLDFSALDLSRYLELRLDLWITGTATQSPMVYGTINGVTTGYKDYVDNNASAFKSAIVSNGQPVRATYLLRDSGAGTLSAVAVGEQGAGFAFSGCGLAGLQTMKLYFYAGNIAAGFHASLYGLKK